MLVRYIAIFDQENPKDPNGENVAKELEQVISEIEKSERVKLISSCFIGRKIVDEPGSYALLDEDPDMVECYQLFFR